MPRRADDRLNDRLKEVLRAIESFQEENGYPPSIREIGDMIGVESTSQVNYYLEKLKRIGVIARDQHVSRGIRMLTSLAELTGEAATAIRQSVEWLRIPLLGRIVAGEPVPVPSSTFSYYDPESMVDVASSLIPSWERSSDLFALEVQGDSMIDAMVYDGDIVILKPAERANNGEMVAVWLNDREETTLKYFYLENGRVRLQPANPTMQPIYIDDPHTVQIQGKVVMVIRQVRGLAA